MSELIARKEQRRFEHHPKLVWQKNTPWKTVPAVVTKIVKPAFDDQPAKVEISISQADDLFREIRIENNFTGVDGGPVALTNGARLDVTFEAETKKTGSCVSAVHDRMPVILDPDGYDLWLDPGMKGPHWCSEVNKPFCPA